MDILAKIPSLLLEGSVSQRNWPLSSNFSSSSSGNIKDLRHHTQYKSMDYKSAKAALVQFQGKPLPSVRRRPLLNNIKVC